MALRDAEVQRLQQRCAELDQLLKSQGTVLEKVQSIESAVSAQKESELSRLTQERDEARQSK